MPRPDFQVGDIITFDMSGAYRKVPGLLDRLGATLDTHFLVTGVNSAYVDLGPVEGQLPRAQRSDLRGWDKLRFKKVEHHMFEHFNVGDTLVLKPAATQGQGFGTMRLGLAQQKYPTQQYIVLETDDRYNKQFVTVKGTVDGEQYPGVYATRFEQATARHPSSAGIFKPGDRVRLQHGEPPYNNAPVSLPAPDGPDTVYEVVRYRTDFYPSAYPRIYVRIPGEQRKYGDYYTTRFVKVAEPEAVKEGQPMPQNNLPNNAMSIEQARQAKKDLLGAGIAEADIRIRSRSWDNDGRYFAVDVAGGSGRPASLYSVAKVAEYIAQMTPIDLTPYMESTRLNRVKVYQFLVPGERSRYLQAPDGSYWFTEADIRKVGGIVTFDGKRYRLGRQQFVPFVS